MADMTYNEIVSHMRDALDKKIIKVMSTDGYRYYTDVLTETVEIPITDNHTTAQLYKKLMIDNQQTSAHTTGNAFQDRARVIMKVGQPDTGKTYAAIKEAEDMGIKPILLMCRDSLTLETLLEDFTLIDGKPAYIPSPALRALTDPNKGEAIIIMDEFNTLLTGVMKTTQPIFDDTSKTFTYRGNTYEKNMNCKFTVTLNDKDKGISIVPDAILSRSKLEYYNPVAPQIIAKWTGVPLKWIQDLRSIYKIAGLLNVFGTRQIKTIRKCTNIQEIQNHLYGLCMMKNIDGKVIDTLQVKNLLTQL